MSARLARGAFASLRASARTRTTTFLPARRNMSAQSHGGHSKKSDMPWIVGAAVLFGPAFLYLVSPSARKPQHAHNDHHNSPTMGNHEPEIMKDDEGTPADVTATIALSEASDVPKDSQSPEIVATTVAAAEQAPIADAVKAAPPAEKEETSTSETENTPEAAPAEPAAEAPATSTTATRAEA